jgi:SAM-dependent methyltransferase
VSDNPPPIPWTHAYHEVRERSLTAALHDPNVVAAFADGAPLPTGYGRGLDERLVELPWFIAHLPRGSGRLLDAGSSLNHATLLELPPIAAKRLHVVTLAPEYPFFAKPGVSYVFEDLRHLPFVDGLYDVVASISTIEHIGCDNSYYIGGVASAEARLDDFALAVREMRRVLAPGGVLLLTVPYGAYQFHGAFQQFDRQRLSAAVDAFGPAAEISESFFKLSTTGWQRALDRDCAESKYVEWVAALMRTGRRPEAPQLEPDYAAAARAVACVKMVKPR